MFLALVGIWIAAIASPGPDTVQIIRLGATSRTAGVACAVGIMVGNTFWILTSLLGLSALVTAVPEILAMLQIVGGAYLLSMGVGAVRAGLQARSGAGAGPEAETTPSDTPMSAPRALRTGIYTNLANPKAVLFFGAVFAQFITPGMGWQWMVAIALTLVVIGVGWFVGLALVVDKLAGFLGRWGHAVDVVTGLIFVALAIWMIVEGALSLAELL